MKGMINCCFQKIVFFWGYLYGIISSRKRIASHMAKIDREVDQDQGEENIEVVFPSDTQEFYPPEINSTLEPAPLLVPVYPPSLEIFQGGAQRKFTTGDTTPSEETNDRRAHLRLVWDSEGVQEAI
jgi:hypothetical protein